MFLAAGIGAGLAAIVPRSTWANAHIVREHKLNGGSPRADCRCFCPADRSVGLPWHCARTRIRVKQGERLRVLVENRLPQETTVHWHGLRVPNAMDGVPHLTQVPIAPGHDLEDTAHHQQL